MDPAPAPPAARSAPRGRISGPPPTVRVRLTALYSGLFLLSGTLLIAVIYLWYERRAARTISVATSGTISNTSPARSHGGLGTAATATQASPQAAPVPPEMAQVVGRLKNTMLQQLLTVSGISLVLLLLIAVLLGWYMAGRALRPVHEITTTARRLSWENLHDRIALTGPRGGSRNWRTPSMPCWTGCRPPPTASGASSPTPPTSCVPR